MKKEKWHNGQIVLTNDLQRAQSTKQDAILDRTIDAYKKGIVKGELNQFAITPSLAGGSNIDVGNGLAYTISGERVYINDTLVYPNAPTAPKIGTTGPTTQSPNGLGGYSSTPQSTGRLNIPLESGKYNYVFIKNLDTTDTSVTSATTTAGEIIYPKIDEGYEIKIVSSPTFVADAYTLIAESDDSLCVGYVNYVAGGAVDPSIIYGTIDEKYQGIEWLSVETELLRATIDPDPVETRKSYSNQTEITLSEHVNAIGSGTITKVNPHGLTLQDLGAILKSTENHEKYIHASGISAPNAKTSTVSALFGNINGKGEYPFPEIDDVVIEGFAEFESAIQYGETANNADIPYRYFIYFRESPTGYTYLADGTYIVYLDLSTKRFGLASNEGAGATFYIQIKDRALPIANIIGNYTGTVINYTALNANPRLMKLWQLDFTTSGTHQGGRISTNILPPWPPYDPLPAGISNFTNRVDLRKLGTIGTDQIQASGSSDVVTLDHHLQINQNINATGNINAEGQIKEKSFELIPPGIVLPYAGVVNDTGLPITIGLYLLCNGAEVSRTTYSELFSAIGTAHGSGDGSTTFRLPDYRGRFLRGVSGLSANDPDKLGRTAMNAGGSTGNQVGSVQEDQLVSHYHHMRTSNSADLSGYPAAGYQSSFDFNTDPTGGNETRPKNAYVNYLIKY